MRFQQAIPPGPDVSPESRYTGLALGERAPVGRPYVVANFVSTADGKATAQGRTAQLGGESDRRVFHLLRTQVDAVLAGTGTLAVERYGPLVRDPRMADIRVAEGRPPQPLAVVISRSGHIPFEIPLFADARARIALYAPPEAMVPRIEAEVSRHDLPAGDGLGGVMRSLRADHEVRSLLCEGGPALLNAMLAEDLVDELFLTLAPALAGGGELGITTGVGLPALLPLRLVWALEHEANLFLRYSRR
ncbi:MAG TPA: dihydrofolate reductase family protein [Solirubrobacteraceae bacterium]|jgi:5-amino-6-(5-phosphoribosylamino)uracil reductase|nr:dihydrofolate reductase family protein [Solirubrobacteraceae bacterium]